MKSPLLFPSLAGIAVACACSAAPTGILPVDGGADGDAVSTSDDAGAPAEAGGSRRDSGADARPRDAAKEAEAPGCKFVDGESFVSGPTCSKIKQLSCDGVDYEIDCNCRIGTCSCVKNGAVYQTIDVASGTCSSVCQDVYADDLTIEQAECGIE